MNNQLTGKQGIYDALPTILVTLVLRLHSELLPNQRA